ncbi:SH3 domain-containing protein [Phenylobacterium sp.]|uniref:SH3 domain-containing protein n=1 Tax=Phenylobacterium sp. TaxID=1871053 RepID=UPI00352271D1
MGQGEPELSETYPHPLSPARALLALIALALGLLLSSGATAREAGQTPSGFEVPRYLTLKFGEVNARAGPGDDHQVLWVYRVRGLPVQVIAETREWRRICDPEGGVAWVHRRVTDGNRSVMNLAASPLALRRRPRAEAEITAYLNVRAVAALDRCDKGWCRLKVDDVTGWVTESAVWGVAAPVQCR